MLTDTSEMTSRLVLLARSSHWNSSEQTLYTVVRPWTSLLRWVVSIYIVSCIVTYHTLLSNCDWFAVKINRSSLCNRPKSKPCSQLYRPWTSLLKGHSNVPLKRGTSIRKKVILYWNFAKGQHSKSTGQMLWVPWVISRPGPGLVTLQADWSCWVVSEKVKGKLWWKHLYFNMK